MVQSIVQGEGVKYSKQFNTSSNSIFGVQPSPRDSMNREIFAMLDDIRIANKKNPLSKSSNMAAMT